MTTFAGGQPMIYRIYQFNKNMSRRSEGGTHILAFRICEVDCAIVKYIYVISNRGICSVCGALEHDIVD